MSRYYFLCGQWLALDEDDGELLRVLPVAGEEEVKGFNNLFFTNARQKISDDHLWLSVVYRSVCVQGLRHRVSRPSGLDPGTETQGLKALRSGSRD